MKVLHILNELRLSGAEVMLKVAAPIWEKKGLELYILSTGEVQGLYTKPLKDAGFTIYHLPFKKALSFLFKYRKLISENNFDVIHIHTERAYLMYTLIAKLYGVPVIIRTIHSNFQFTGFTKYKLQIRRKLMRWLGATQVSVSQGVYENELALFGNSTTLISNWYDNKRFRLPSKEERMIARNKLEIDIDEKVIITIGNCSPIKNHALLLQALANLQSQINEFVYLHIGEEENGYPERLLAQELGISSHVIFLGPQNDILPFLWASDIYVMPSLYEGLSISTLEAMACGLHAILTDVPGLRDIGNFISDILYINQHADELTAAIKTISDSEEPVPKENLKRLIDNFSCDKGAMSYFEIYGGKEYSRKL